MPAEEFNNPNVADAIPPVQPLREMAATQPQSYDNYLSSLRPVSHSSLGGIGGYGQLQSEMSSSQQQHSQSLINDDYLDTIKRRKQQFEYTMLDIQTLFQEYAKLRKDLDDTRLDWNGAMEHNRSLQRELQGQRSELEQLKNATSVNHYALVLVDGDGMIFKNDLIKQGRAGGEEAAKRLYKQVYDATGLKPIIRVFASIGRLAGVFSNGGLITSPSTFREFTLGFNDPSHEHIDFIDVGEGKEKADWKLNSELKWHLKNYNCRAIFLGGSHDNGYARVLKELAAREPAEELAKIQLLEGPPFSRELTDLPYPKVKYANVFSPEKFDAYQQARGAAFGPPPGLATPIGTKRNSQSNGFPALGTGGSAAAPGSYAAAVITAPANPPTASNTSAARGSPKQTKAKIVSAEQNINDAVKRIKTLQPKPCNNFYLKGDCPYHWNDQCKFGHDYPLNPDELEAMRLLARTKQCTWGDRCINEKCYYSHDAE